LLEAGAKLTVPPGLTALGGGDYSTADRLAALELFHGQAAVSDADMIAAIGTGPGGVLGGAVMSGDTATVDWILDELDLDDADHGHVFPALGLGVSRGVAPAVLADIAESLGLADRFRDQTVSSARLASIDQTSALLDLGRGAPLAGDFDAEALDLHAAHAGAQPDAKNQHQQPQSALPSPPAPHHVTAWATEAMELVLRARAYIDSKQNANGRYSNGKKSRRQAWKQSMMQLCQTAGTSMAAHPDPSGQLARVVQMAQRTMADLAKIGA
jgi:hypothetical protein